MQTSPRLCRPGRRPSESDALETLAAIACLSNKLAKLIKSTPYQCLAYEIKALALSSLVVSGVATPNGIHPDGTVGLSFLGSQLHCPTGKMSTEARAVVTRKCATVQITGPLADRLSARELASIGNLVCNRAA